jgi:hypothetical protein
MLLCRYLATDLSPDQGTVVFRIDVLDHGKRGINDAYGIIISDGYVSGQKQLKGGNVTIHRE